MGRGGPGLLGGTEIQRGGGKVRVQEWGKKVSVVVLGV